MAEADERRFYQAMGESARRSAAEMMPDHELRAAILDRPLGQSAHG